MNKKIAVFSWILVTVLSIGISLWGINNIRMELEPDPVVNEIIIESPKVVRVVLVPEELKSDPVNEKLSVSSERNKEKLDMLSKYSEDEINLLARVIMSEVGSTSTMDSKRAVAEVVLNRVNDSQYPNTINDVVYSPNQFCTGNNGSPTEDCYRAARLAITDPMFPNDMFWFQLGKPSYGYEYYYDGKTHFSTRANYKGETQDEI